MVPYNGNRFQFVSCRTFLQLGEVYVTAFQGYMQIIGIVIKMRGDTKVNQVGWVSEHLGHKTFVSHHELTHSC